MADASPSPKPEAGVPEAVSDLLEAYLTTAARLTGIIVRIGDIDREALDFISGAVPFMQPESFALVKRLADRHDGLRDELDETLKTMAGQFAAMAGMLLDVKP